MNKQSLELGHEIADFMRRGFKAAWMSDLKIGDIFAGPRLFASDPPRQLFVVERIMKIDASYFGPEEEEIVPNVVINLIVTDEEGLERHLMYGHTNAIYIWRG